MKYYLGLDVGSISTKGVLIDAAEGKTAASEYIWTEGDPAGASRRAVNTLLERLPKGARPCDISGVGTTGSARALAGVLLSADIVKNEITAHAVGTLSVFPEVRTILEIGGQDSKIILINNGLVIDYAMNTLCAAGTGSFLSSQAKRLGTAIEDFGALALKAERAVSIAARCTVFAESDLVHKAQIGYKKEDIIAGLCAAVVSNYLNNLAKGKKIKPPVVFQGGVSKNTGVLKAFEAALGEKVLVHEDGHLMGALGAALLCRRAKIDKPFDPALLSKPFETTGAECGGCANNCELIKIYRDGSLIDTWGSRCGAV